MALIMTTIMQLPKWRKQIRIMMPTTQMITPPTLLTTMSYMAKMKNWKALTFRNMNAYCTYEIDINIKFSFH